jgi:hypothetical protein
MIRVYQLDTRWACGAVTTLNGIIQKERTAPIFRNLSGQELSLVIARGNYKATLLDPEESQAP